MKKIINILSITLLLAVSSCTDLDLQPLSSTTPEVFFSDESAYKAFIARVYAGLAVTGQQGPAGNSDITSLDEGFSNYIRQYWQLQELPTEEAVLAWGDAGIPDLHNHTWTSDNQFIRAIYYRIFYQVSIANEFLRETTDAKLDERKVSDAIRTQIQAYRAEARFLRALSYWHAIDFFGDVPFYTEESGIGSSAPDQAARATVFEFIEKELTEIEPNMVAAGANDYGRADRAALWMLQAKLYLNGEVYAGKSYYNQCVEACKKIINSGAFSLQENYANLFLADNNTSPEIIFAVPFDGENTQGYGGTTYLVHASVGGSMDPNNFGIDGGWSGLRTTKALPDLFPDVTGAVDKRALFYTTGQNKEIAAITNFNDGYAVRKYRNVTSDGIPGSDKVFADTDYPMFRLADAYLMYAEAVLRGGSGGDRATALAYINQLRTRAYGNNSGNITDTQLTLDFILNERGRELYWEGHRRTDLIRYQRFTENGIWPWKGGVPAGKTTEAFRNVYPFPASEILANPKLKQNQGY